MTTILLYDTICTFNGDVWKCEPQDGDANEVLERMLNDTFDADDVPYGAGFTVSKYDKTVTGVDGFALDAIALFKPKVINHAEYLVPEVADDIIL